MFPFSEMDAPARRRIIGLGPAYETRYELARSAFFVRGGESAEGAFWPIADIPTGEFVTRRERCSPLT